MADTSNRTGCTEPEAQDASSPFYAPNYHFGMLLGVDDFETEQGYHRGKHRLHNAWLHREGVVWGLEIKLDLPRGELRILPGLALDACGRELHVDSDRCLNVGKWYELHRNEPALAGALSGNTVTFDAHVAARFARCLTRPVPALAEPCEGAVSETAFSRVFETVELQLCAGRAPVRTLPYHRVRLLFGLDAAAGAEDQAVLDERARIMALPAADRPAATAAAFHRFAALDAAALHPAESTDGGGWIYPATGEPWLPLADITAIKLEQADSGWKLTGGEVDLTVRPVLLATAAIQELVCAAGPGGAGAGPSVASVAIAGKKVTMTFTADLHAGSVSTSAFSVTALDDTGWRASSVASVAYDSAARTATLSLGSAPNGKLVRVVAAGTGAAPLMGADFTPLGGGTDFVYSEKRS